MKGAAGMRILGILSAAYAAVMAASTPDVFRPTIMDRAPRFLGIGPSCGKFKNYTSASKYKPHQGARECARRREQFGLGKYLPS